MRTFMCATALLAGQVAIATTISQASMTTTGSTGHTSTAGTQVAPQTTLLAYLPKAYMASVIGARNCATTLALDCMGSNSTHKPSFQVDLSDLCPILSDVAGERYWTITAQASQYEATWSGELFTGVSASATISCGVSGDKDNLTKVCLITGTETQGASTTTVSTTNVYPNPAQVTIPITAGANNISTNGSVCVPTSTPSASVAAPTDGAAPKGAAAPMTLRDSAAVLLPMAAVLAAAAFL